MSTKLHPATSTILSIAADIPCLARKMNLVKTVAEQGSTLQYFPKTSPWLVERHEEWHFDPDKFKRCIGPWSHGEILSAMFILNVWNPSYAKQKRWHFNLMDFIGTADGENREGLMKWLNNPKFP